MTVAWDCEYAWLGGEDAVSDVRIVAVGGVITDVLVGGARSGDGQRLPGVVVPGFANAHSHAFHRALRGRTSRRRGSFWTWRDSMYELAGRMTPDSLRALATAAFAEMLEAGYTTIGEFHYLHHQPDGTRYDDPNELTRAVLDAARSADVRLTLLDTCYLMAAPGVDAHGVQLRFTDGSSAAWAQRVSALGHVGPDVRVGAAAHSVRAVGPDDIATVASWASQNAAPLHAHVSEQVRENEESQHAYGATPTAVLAAAGALSPRFTAVHATHVTGHDRAELAQAGATVCVCPTTERDLGDGICELGALEEAEIAVAIGTDSAAIVDPFEELRALDGHERLRTMARGALAPAAALGASSSGHAALGWPGVGGIAPGAVCDLVAVSLDSVRVAGARSGAVLDTVLAGASAVDVTHVVRDGRLVVADGRHRTLDVAALLEASIARAWA